MPKEISRRQLRILVPHVLSLPGLGIPYRFEVSEATEGTMGKIHTFLEKKPKHIGIIAISHITRADSMMILEIAGLIDPHAKRDFFGFVSDWQMKSSRVNRIVIEGGARLLDARIQRVIQRSKWKNYEKIEKMDSLIEATAFLEATRNHADTTPSLFAIAPEGTRSERGVLIKGDVNTSNVVEKLSDALVMPVALEYLRNDWSREGLNFGPVRLAFAEPLISTETRPVTHSDMMTSLASVLPEEMQGHWSESLKSWPPSDLPTLSKWVNYHS